MKGVIFENPQTEKWETADEYLSGEVRQKLASALYYAEKEPERWAQNVESLKAVQPKDLDAGVLPTLYPCISFRPEKSVL